MESTTLWQKAHVQLLVSLVLIASIFALTAFGVSALEGTKDWVDGPVTINVSGEGEVMVVPDIGSFTFGVQAEGEDAVSAQSNSAEAINAITAFLRESGVEERDIETSNYNLNPKYTYEQRTCAAGSYCPPGERVVDGFEVSQMITVKIRDLDAAGVLISGVGDRGATNISSLSFTIDDTDSLIEEARAAAIADAKTNADILAKQLGVKVVKMVGYYEEEDGMSPKVYGGEFMERSFMADAAIAPDMPVGEDAVNVKVNITYEIQ